MQALTVDRPARAGERRDAPTRAGQDTELGMRMFSPAPEDDEDPHCTLDSGETDNHPQRLLVAQRASALIQAAARHLGMSEPAAHRVAETSSLRSGDKRVAFRALGLSESGRLSMAVSVDTEVPIDGHDEPQRPLSILRRAPGLFWAFSTAFAATADGHWAVLRKIDLDPQGGSALAAHVVETLQLTEYLLQDGTLTEH